MAANFSTLAEDASQLVCLAQAAYEASTEVATEGGTREQRDSIVGISAALVKLLGQHEAALDEAEKSSRQVGDSTDSPAHHDAVTIHSLCETALQADNDGHDITALLMVLKEKTGALADALEGKQ
ncbi:hypothetical protein ACW9UR_13745 [Halovulum sp. GXIMD14794]